MVHVRVEVPRPVQLGSLKSENEGQAQSWLLRDGDVVLEGWIWLLKIATFQVPDMWILRVDVFCDVYGWKLIISNLVMGIKRGPTHPIPPSNSRPYKGSSWVING